MGKAPKVTTVYDSTAAGVADVLNQAISDEPAPTHGAHTIISDAEAAGPLGPLGPPDSLAGGGSAAADVPMVAGNPRQAAENLLLLAFACAPAEWQPDESGEREELIAAVERVFEWHGIAPTLPPHLALIAVVGKYGRKRMARPAVRARLGPFLARVPFIGRMMGATDQGDASTPAADPADSTFAGLPHMTTPHDAR